jgi:hypothetical protein
MKDMYRFTTKSTKRRIVETLLEGGFEGKYRADIKVLEDKLKKAKAEQLSQFRDPFKNCSSELFFAISGVVN